MDLKRFRYILNWAEICRDLGLVYTSTLRRLDCDNMPEKESRKITEYLAEKGLIVL